MKILIVALLLADLASATVFKFGFLRENRVKFLERSLGSVTFCVPKGDVSIYFPKDQYYSLPHALKSLIGSKYGPILRAELKLLYAIFTEQAPSWSADAAMVSMLLYCDAVEDILKEILRDPHLIQYAGADIGNAVKALKQCMFWQLQRDESRLMESVFSIIKYFPIVQSDQDGSLSKFDDPAEQIILPMDVISLVYTFLPPHYIMSLRLVCKAFHDACLAVAVQTRRR